MQREAVASGFEGASPHRGPGLVDTQGVGAVSLKNNADRRATAGRLCFSGRRKRLSGNAREREDGFQFKRGLRLQLVLHRGAVDLHGVLGDPELDRDLLVEHPARDPHAHVALALGKLREPLLRFRFLRLPREEFLAFRERPVDRGLEP